MQISPVQMLRNGMTAVISIKHPDPRFEGQTKTKLDNQDASRITAKVTGDEIQLFFDKNLEILKNSAFLCGKSSKDSQDRGKGKDKSADETEIFF